jgi:hypothetical protein
MVEVAIGHILELDVWFFEQLVLDATKIVNP